MKKFVALCGCLVFVLAMPAAAQIDWNDNPADWDAIKAEKGKVSKGAIDFDDDVWPELVDGFHGPLTSAGDPTLPVSPGVVLDNVIFDTVGYESTTNLVGVAPDAGFGAPGRA